MTTLAAHCLPNGVDNLVLRLSGMSAQIDGRIPAPVLKAVCEKRLGLQYSRFYRSSTGSRAQCHVQEAAQRVRPHPKCGAAASETEEGNHY